jgi:hypothetical protein
VNSKFFSAVYKHSPIGLVIINEKTQLVDVNDYMLSSFHLSAPDYKYKQFGNVFGCVEVAGSDAKARFHCAVPYRASMCRRAAPSAFPLPGLLSCRPALPLPLPALRPFL